MKRIETVLQRLGALGCALGVAAAAWAGHAADPGKARSLAIVAAFAFGHGLALLAIDFARWRGGRVLVLGIAGGCLLFCASLLASALLDLRTGLAPWGGGLLIGCWLALAAMPRARED